MQQQCGDLKPCSPVCRWTGAALLQAALSLGYGGNFFLISFLTYQINAWNSYFCHLFESAVAIQMGKQK